MSQLINTMRLRGRVVGVRQIGKIKFLDVMRDHRITQLTTTCQEMVRRGDFIEAAGEQCVTRDGQIGIKSDQFKVINVFKGIHFPDRKMGDVECERHVDLLANPASNTIFRQRANIIQNLRQFLISQGFLEVETPILSKNANGAVARPFITKSVVDDADLYLRIAPELYLKRLIIGGFERVFEIGKVFRNEGVDSTHNPEFTSLELYQSFAYFEDLVKLVKVIFESLAADGSLAIKQHIDIMSVLRDNKIELDYGSELRPQLEHYAKEHDLYEQKCTDSKLFDRLVGKYVEPLCREPTIITGFPLFTSPLATASPNNPHLADRLEVYVDCKEVANGYQELTDADEQEIRFAMQQRDRDERLDMDSPLPDSDYIEALRLGMPPTIGLGIGMDRLVMLLTKQRSIKNVIFFPH